ncbi:MAG TPA: bis(5'-nucleosyl)-tetraphosphatase [archaeon]|nr:bis(5'-nucleosyl)-tetraphosphatase [archaeon]
MVTSKEEKSAGVVVFRGAGGEKKYLLLHYALGHWDLVKGHVEKGETGEETARRECLEETGIKDLELVPGFREGIEYSYTRGSERVHKAVTFYLAETLEEKVTLSFEHQGFAWLSFKEAMERLTFENAKGVLRKADAFLE